MPDSTTVLDFELGTDHVLIDDRYFGASFTRLTQHITTASDGSAWLGLSPTEGVLFHGVAAAALQQHLGDFSFV